MQDGVIDLYSLNLAQDGSTPRSLRPDVSIAAFTTYTGMCELLRVFRRRET